MEQIPIIIDGVTCGQAELRREGAYVICRGSANWQGGLVRLWLYGGGEPAYLGVLQPDGTVRKQFSLRDFARLPAPITHCGNSDRETASEREEADRLWVRQSDGSLLQQGGGYVALPAEGVRLPRGYAGVRREIEGREYVIFPW